MSKETETNKYISFEYIDGPNTGGVTCRICDQIKPDQGRLTVYKKIRNTPLKIEIIVCCDDCNKELFSVSQSVLPGIKTDKL